MKIIKIFIFLFIFTGCYEFQPYNDTSGDPKTWSDEKVLRVAAGNEKFPIVINKMKSSSPNSASGVDAIIKYRNMSSKVIKYAYFTVVPYNGVGDPVACSIRNKRAMLLKDTGPIKPGEYSDGVWGCIWYNWSIKSIKITWIKIIYMDNTQRIVVNKKNINRFTETNTNSVEKERIKLINKYNSKNI